MFTAAKVNVDILACSGATTRELLSPQINPGSGTSFADAQLAQLNALTTTPGAAIMTIGGNDIGFKDILAQCISPQAACTDDDNWRQTVLAYPGEIVPTLVTAYENTWRVLNQPKFVAKRGGKYAPLIVVGYPLVAWDPKNGVCSFANIGGLVHHDLNVAELKFAKNLETNLDGAINEAVDEAHAAGYGVVYSDATVSAFQPDNTVCASQSERFVNQIKLDPTVAGDVDPESFHPNVNGYKSESEALIAWSKSKAAAVPTDLPAAEKIAANQSSLNTLLASIPGPTVPALLDPDPIPPTVVAPGQGVVIQGFKVPTGPVTVTLHSQPRILGMLEPNSKGEVHGYITIPADVSYGPHELVIEGWDKNGKPVIKTANINVRPVTPFWVDAIGLYGGWLVLASLVVTIGMWLRSRRTRFTKGIG